MKTCEEAKTLFIRHAEKQLIKLLKQLDKEITVAIKYSHIDCWIYCPDGLIEKAVTIIETFGYSVHILADHQRLEISGWAKDHV